MSPRSLKSKAGFTLIEIMVAIAIAGFGLFAIFQLQKSITDGEQRYAQALDRATIIRNATVLLKEVNPSDTSDTGTGTSGTIALPPSLTLNWTAEQVTDQQYNVTFPATTQGNWYVQLWTVTGQVVDANGNVLQTITVDRVGYVNPTTAGAQTG